MKKNPSLVITAVIVQACSNTPITLAHLFPTDAKEFHDLANEESLSRFEASVHFRGDNEARIKLGKEEF